MECLVSSGKRGNRIPHRIEWSWENDRFKNDLRDFRPTKGSVTIDGVRSDTIKAYQIVEQGVSLVPEGRRLFRDMTVLENLEIGRLYREGTTTER